MTIKKNDLGLVVATKEEALWINVKKEAEMLIQNSKDNLLIQTAILELANAKIKETK